MYIDAMKQAQQIDAKRAQEIDADGLGPRMQLILQQAIAPWKREKAGDEEAQLAEIRRRPVRHRFDAAEAKRRLGAKPAKKSRTRGSRSAS